MVTILWVIAGIAILGAIVVVLWPQNKKEKVDKKETVTTEELSVDPSEEVVNEIVTENTDVAEVPVEFNAEENIELLDTNNGMVAKDTAVTPDLEDVDTVEGETLENDAGANSIDEVKVKDEIGSTSEEVVIGKPVSKKRFFGRKSKSKTVPVVNDEVVEKEFIKFEDAEPEDALEELEATVDVSANEFGYKWRPQPLGEGGLHLKPNSVLPVEDPVVDTPPIKEPEIEELKTDTMNTVSETEHEEPTVVAENPHAVPKEEPIEEEINEVNISEVVSKETPVSYTKESPVENIKSDKPEEQVQELNELSLEEEIRKANEKIQLEQKAEAERIALLEEAKKAAQEIAREEIKQAQKANPFEPDINVQEKISENATEKNLSVEENQRLAVEDIARKAAAAAIEKAGLTSYSKVPGQTIQIVAAQAAMLAADQAAKVNHSVPLSEVVDNATELVINQLQEEQTVAKPVISEKVTVDKVKTTFNEDAVSDAARRAYAEHVVAQKLREKENAQQEELERIASLTVQKEEEEAAATRAAAQRAYAELETATDVAETTHTQSLIDVAATGMASEKLRREEATVLKAKAEADTRATKAQQKAESKAASAMSAAARASQRRTALATKFESLADKSSRTAKRLARQLDKETKKANEQAALAAAAQREAMNAAMAADRVLNEASNAQTQKYVAATMATHKETRATFAAAAEAAAASHKPAVEKENENASLAALIAGTTDPYATVKPVAVVKKEETVEDTSEPGLAYSEVHGGSSPLADIVLNRGRRAAATEIALYDIPEVLPPQQATKK